LCEAQKKKTKQAKKHTTLATKNRLDDRKDMGNLLQTLAEWNFRSRTDPTFAFRFTTWLAFVVLVLFAIPFVALGGITDDSASWYVYFIVVAICLGVSLILGGIAYLSASYVTANMDMYQKQGLSKEKAFEQALADRRHHETQWTVLAASRR
jgi:acyl-homoserine lactone acylase PvdQ